MESVALVQSNFRRRWQLRLSLTVNRVIELI